MLSGQPIPRGFTSLGFFSTENKNKNKTTNQIKKKFFKGGELRVTQVF